jgi:hypothetical protein
LRSRKARNSKSVICVQLLVLLFCWLLTFESLSLCRIVAIARGYTQNLRISSHFDEFWQIFTKVIKLWHSNVIRTRVRPWGALGRGYACFTCWMTHSIRQRVKSRLAVAGEGVVYASFSTEQTRIKAPEPRSSA